MDVFVQLAFIEGKGTGKQLSGTLQQVWQNENKINRQNCRAKFMVLLKDNNNNKSPQSKVTLFKMMKMQRNFHYEAVSAFT